MIPVKCREKVVKKLPAEWAERIYRYGVFEMAQKIKAPPTNLYNKLNGRSTFFEDEVEKIDAELKRQFEADVAALQK
jgi:hypothetical protein